jgi:hypothetical protein
MGQDSQTLTSGSLDRRAHFRAYMNAFNPSAPARQIIQAGLVVDELHASLYRRLAGRADLAPGSQQLLVGGIGSGKTTELLLAEKWLRSEQRAVSLYIDITAETDLSGFNSGALLASFGRHLLHELIGRLTELSEEQKKAIENAKKAVQEFCYGKTEAVWVPFEEEPDWDSDEQLSREVEAEEPPQGYFKAVRVPGKLKPPLPALRRELQTIRQTLESLVALARGMTLDVVAIFDGLDRLLSPENFWAVAHQDFRMLRDLSVSVLATAPISILYGAGQPVSEQFERVHHLAPVRAAEPLLQLVLQRRCSDTGLLNERNAAELCTYSGGVLRDLITLARDAGEEAYIAGADCVRDEDIELSVRQLGTAYLRGLGPEEITALWMLHEKRSFNLSQTTNLKLLVTRRVIEYSSTDFRVHPALFRVLPKTGQQ